MLGELRLQLLPQMLELGNVEGQFIEPALCVLDLGIQRAQFVAVGPLPLQILVRVVAGDDGSARGDVGKPTAEPFLFRGAIFDRLVERLA